MVHDRFRESTRVSLGEADRDGDRPLAPRDRTSPTGRSSSGVRGRAGPPSCSSAHQPKATTSPPCAITTSIPRPSRRRRSRQPLRHRPSQRRFGGDVRPLPPHACYGLEVLAVAFGLIADDVQIDSTQSMVAEWQRLTRAVNEIAVGLGHALAVPVRDHVRSHGQARLRAPSGAARRHAEVSLVLGARSGSRFPLAAGGVRTSASGTAAT